MIHHPFKTKIVATLGPASLKEDVMKRMVEAGVSVFRVNCSHGNPDSIRKSIRLIREINKKYDYSVAVLADLQGPKLRIGEVKEGTVIKKGDELIFTNVECEGNEKCVFMTYQQFAGDVTPGERILLDDGKIILKVKETNGKNEVKAEVVQGGPLKSRKGVNLPNTKVSLPCLTPKDLEDLEVALEEEVEWLGLSFVRTSKDVEELRQILKSRKSNARIISKIEKPEAVEDIDAIMDFTDAVMVARGDLGVEVPMHEVPLIQKTIVQKALKKSRPVIIATQMMESMMENLSPSRAEVNDVANSVLDSADAMMLSGETSVGNHPVEVVEMMANIIKHVEDSEVETNIEDNPPLKKNKRFITDSICYNASKIADQIGAKGILTMTHSGYTAFRIAAHRPHTNILVFTANKTILNMLSLVWGVQAFYYDRLTTTDDTFADIKGIIEDHQIVVKGDLLVKIASMPIKELGMTNMLKISKV